MDSNWSVAQILSDLHRMSNPEYISKMQYFGITGGKALGIKNAELKPFAKVIGRNQELAKQLWNQPIHEAKLLAIHMSSPKTFEKQTAEKWTREAYSWDLVDGIGMKLVGKSAYAFEKIEEWSKREPEFEKRMAFAVMVGVTLNKKISDEEVETFFSIIEREASDDRNFVKKAVSWALRQIGKRNLSLNELAIQCAQKLIEMDSKSATWIGRDAYRELRSRKVYDRLVKKS
ncbi:MAG: DNA alkylation repair protein [Cyclobacteriaceae bacterium]